MRVAGRGQREWSYAGRVQFVLLHIPHFLPAVVGLGFLARFGVYAMRLPPAHLSDEELAEWHRQKQAARRRTARRGDRNSPPLDRGPAAPRRRARHGPSDLHDRSARRPAVGGDGVDAHAHVDRRPRAGRLQAARARGGPHARGAASAGTRFTEGMSLLLLSRRCRSSCRACRSSGTRRTGRSSPGPTSSSPPIWMVVFQIHVFRYLGRALRATQVGAGEGAPPPARQAG